MPNLVGIGNSQVPTNAMLGGLAYQNSNNVSIEKGELGNIAEIRAKLNITPIDTNHYGIFVYDTSMDSDGGAWRHRTSHTSWYNEAPSKYRGHRKEFPSIAVIASDTDQVSIYDGDDPNLPLWMTFQSYSSGGGMAPNYVLQYSGASYMVAMMNGILVLGQGSAGDNWGNPIVNFISEEIVRADPHTTEGGRWAGNIASRNGYNGAAAEGYVDKGSGFIIRDSRISGVAMRVMSDAITDKKTGLPIPTIALATGGGISVITAKDENRSVYDITASAGSSYNASSFCDLTETGCIIFEQDNTNGRSIFHVPIPTGDRTSDTNDGSITDKVILKPYVASGTGANNSNQYPRFNEPQGTNAGVMKGVAMRGNNQALLTTAGKITLLEPNFYDPAKGRTAYITTISNTGWMWGGNRGAFLCDTDPTAINTTNLVTNGSFGSDISGWTSSGTATMSHQSSSQVLRITGDSGAGSWTGGTIMQDLGNNFVVGKTYSVSYKVRSGGNSGNYSQGFGARIQKNAHFHSSSTEFYRQTTSDPGGSFITISWTFTATVTQYGLQLYNYYGVQGHYLEYDNIVVKEAVADRSPTARIENRTYDTGFVITGSVDKQPVANGSELVSYGNFSTANYLSQQFNTDMNLSDGAFTIMAWIYPTGTSIGGIMSRGSGGMYGPWALSYSGQDITFVSSADWNESNDGGSWGTNVASSGDFCKQNEWSQVVVTKSGSTAKLFINGIRRGQDTSAVNPKAPTSNFIPTMIGVERIGSTAAINRAFPGRLALIRASNTAATEDQVSKMYLEEKKLFTEHAKCTLVGTSNSVNAIAHDDTTKILYVGTGSGRSDFRGLERINSTTTAVSNVISASNGLVAEK